MTTPIPPPANRTPPVSNHIEPFEVELHTLLPVLLGDETLPSPFENTDEYLAMLDGLDIEEADKRALIHILQTLIETVIGIRFGVDPATLELKDRSKKLAQDSVPVIKSSLSKQHSPPVDFTSTVQGAVLENGGADERI